VQVIFIIIKKNKYSHTKTNIMILLRPEEEAKYSDFADTIACSIHINSSEKLKGQEPPKNQEELHAIGQRIGKDVGDATLEKSIEFLKDMSREDLVRWLTQSTAQVVISAMNTHPDFRERIALLSKFKK
jgi:hypothetical protein